MSLLFIQLRFNLVKVHFVKEILGTFEKGLLIIRSEKPAHTTFAVNINIVFQEPGGILAVTLPT